MKVRHLFAKDAIRPPGYHAEHLFVLTSDGRVFERFSDDEPGVWNEVPLPAKRKSKHARNSK